MLVLGGLQWLKDDAFSAVLTERLRQSPMLQGRPIDLINPFDAKKVKQALAAQRYSTLLTIGLEASSEDFMTDLQLRVGLQSFVETVRGRAMWTFLSRRGCFGSRFLSVAPFYSVCTSLAIYVILCAPHCCLRQGGTLVFLRSEPKPVLELMSERFGKAAWKLHGSLKTSYARTAEATALKWFDTAPSTFSVHSHVLEAPAHER